MLGYIDDAAGLMMSTLPARKKLFAEGWGLQPGPLAAHFETAVDPTVLAAAPAIDLKWRPLKPIGGGLKGREGIFVSPVPGLPGSLATGRILEVRPAGEGPDERFAEQRCLLFGAWADEGWKKRLRIARRLAHQGICTVIHETPFHGSRRIRTQGSPIRRVDEHASMTHITVIEGLALLNALSSFTGEWVVAGFSMGASHAGAVIALSGQPLAGALFAVAHSPSIPFIDGVLEKYVSWSALGGRESAEAQLRELLGHISLLSLEVPQAMRRILLVGARQDAFVPSWAVDQLASHWPGAAVEWRRGGHGSLWLFERGYMARAIAARFSQTAS